MPLTPGDGRTLGKILADIESDGSHGIQLVAQFLVRLEVVKHAVISAAPLKDRHAVKTALDALQRDIR